MVQAHVRKRQAFVKVGAKRAMAEKEKALRREREEQQERARKEALRQEGFNTTGTANAAQTNGKTQRFKVQVISAAKLTKVGLFGKSDAYAAVHALPSASCQWTWHRRSSRLTARGGWYRR